MGDCARGLFVLLFSQNTCVSAVVVLVFFFFIYMMIYVKMALTMISRQVKSARYYCFLK